MTIGMLRSLIDAKDDEGKIKIADFIGHRLEGRYIIPQLNVSLKYRSGFSMMASASLLIEAMQAFHEGADKTPDRQGHAYFGDFFARESRLFPTFEARPGEFYKHVRCGILHQAEVTAGYRIVREGPLFDASKRQYNAKLFLETLQQCIQHYVESLKSRSFADPLWKCAINKLEFICLNCKVPT